MKVRIQLVAGNKAMAPPLESLLTTLYSPAQLEILKTEQYALPPKEPRAFHALILLRPPCREEVHTLCRVFREKNPGAKIILVGYRGQHSGDAMSNVIFIEPSLNGWRGAVTDEIATLIPARPPTTPSALVSA